MGPIDYAVIAIVLVIVALAAWYVIRAKKRGVKCIGCSSGDCSCSKSSGKTEGSCSCGCGSCGGCGGCDSSEKSGEEKPEA